MGSKVVVGGFVPFTTIDFPDMLSAVVFLQGCPLRCVYCHNDHLRGIVSDYKSSWDDVLSQIEGRSAFLDAVVFSGGEPLQQSALLSAILDIKKLGLKVGIHTSGFYPDALSVIIDKIDWVGFDFKTSFDKYHEVTGVKNSGKLAEKSLEILINSKIAFEARMTMALEILVDDAVKVADYASRCGVQQFFLQKCRNANGEIFVHPIFDDLEMLKNMESKFTTFAIRE